MLEGIDILNQVEILQWNRSAIFPCIVVLVLVCICAIGVGESRDAGMLFLSLVGAVLFGILLIVMLRGQPSEPTGRYEYTVTIDESVSFTDLYENYEIVEQNGQLWTLRDKKK